MLGLRHERGAMRSGGLIHGESVYPLSATLVAAIALLLVGVIAIISLVFHTWPFG
jgi:putative membrane protein